MNRIKEVKRFLLTILILFCTIILFGCEKEKTDEEKKIIREIEKQTKIYTKYVYTSRGGKYYTEVYTDTVEHREQEIKEELERERKIQEQKPVYTQTEYTGSSYFDQDLLIDDDLVLVSSFIPNINIDLRYATSNNFTNQVIYNFKEAYLRFGTVKKLNRVQTNLFAKNYKISIWDAYRPVEAQYKLWRVKPDNDYVADPNKGYSNHTRGNAVDITLLRLDNSKVSMPSGFDDFTLKGDRNYNDVTEIEKENATLLEQYMKEAGFSPYSKEWWHFNDDNNYDPIDFKPPQNAYIYPKCNNYITLRQKRSTSSKEVLRIPKGSKMKLLAYNRDMCYVEYNNNYGFVNSNYIQFTNK